MDFDELDDLAPVAENKQPPTGTVLEWISRSHRLPGLRTHMHILPEMLQKQVPPHLREQIAKGEKEECRAKVRLLCVHGVADSYKQEWFMLEADAPPEIEVAVHEFPGHGHREREPLLSSIRELADDAFEAFRDAMETGSFALLGHSIGCLVITELAKRAEAELHVKPVAVFMVERGACQWPLFTDRGIAAIKDRELSVALDAKSAADRSLELREKELEDKETVLIVNSTSAGLISSWNANSPGVEVHLYDEVVRVNGVEDTAKAMRAAAEAAAAAGEEVRLDLRRRPYEFLSIYMPDVAMMLKNGPTRALDRWQKSWVCENDTMDVGYHSFSCSLVALSAEASVEATIPLKSLSPELRRVVDFGGKAFNKDIGGGNAFMGHFPRETFDDWSGWTENQGGFKVVECEGCTHMSIKANRRFKDSVYGTLTDMVALWSRT